MKAPLTMRAWRKSMKDPVLVEVERTTIQPEPSTEPPREDAPIEEPPADQPPIEEPSFEDALADVMMEEPDEVASPPPPARKSRPSKKTSRK